MMHEYRNETILRLSEDGHEEDEPEQSATYALDAGIVKRGHKCGCGDYGLHENLQVGQGICPSLITTFVMSTDEPASFANDVEHRADRHEDERHGRES
jgi:hypothetical protein